MELSIIKDNGDRADLKYYLIFYVTFKTRLSFNDEDTLFTIPVVGEDYDSALTHAEKIQSSHASIATLIGVASIEVVDIFTVYDWSTGKKRLISREFYNNLWEHWLSNFSYLNLVNWEKHYEGRYSPVLSPSTSDYDNQELPESANY